MSLRTLYIETLKLLNNKRTTYSSPVERTSVGDDHEIFFTIFYMFFSLHTTLRPISVVPITTATEKSDCRLARIVVGSLVSIYNVVRFQPISLIFVLYSTRTSNANIKPGFHYPS